MYHSTASGQLYTKVGFGTGELIRDFNDITLPREDVQKLHLLLLKHLGQSFALHYPESSIMFREEAYVATGDRSFLILEELSDLAEQFEGSVRDQLITIYSALKRQAYGEGRVIVQLVA